MNKATGYSILAGLSGIFFIIAIPSVPPFWLFTGLWGFLVPFFCGLFAIIAGHVGRFRGRRTGGRGKALLGIIVGWLLVITCMLVWLIAIGIIAGIAVLVD